MTVVISKRNITAHTIYWSETVKAYATIRDHVQSQP